MMYTRGKGVVEDAEEAVKWYRKAAEQGNDEAQNNLGLMYEDGRGVPQDNEVADEWFRRAARLRKRSTELAVWWYWA